MTTNESILTPVKVGQLWEFNGDIQAMEDSRLEFISCVRDHHLAVVDTDSNSADVQNQIDGDVYTMSIETLKAHYILID